jgi:hypothetical protein
LTGTGGLASRRPGPRPCGTQSPDRHPEPGRAQPKRPFPPPRDQPITDRPVQRNSTGCKTGVNVLSFILRYLDDTIMDPKLTAEELSWLKNLDTDSPIKPEVPESIAARLVEQGLAIKLVEGGLQLTTLGREQLADSGGTKES